MSNAYEVYQGGYPVLHSTRKYGQRGSGFFSSLKKFVLPIAKKLLPHAAGAVSDLVSGRSVKDTLKSRAADAGADVVEAAANHGAQALRNLSSSNKPTTSFVAAPKKYKRKAMQAPTQSLSKRKRTINKWQ